MFDNGEQFILFYLLNILLYICQWNKRRKWTIFSTIKYVVLFYVNKLN